MPHRAFRCLVRGGGRAFKAVSPELYYKTVAGLFDEIDAAYEVRTRKGPLFFHCTSETVRVRARVMLVREPDTLAWIETFLPDQVLWDIGANIGVFTLYAARVASARVVAFDP